MLSTKPQPGCRVNPELKCPQALCMCTTRELVAQNLSVLRKMAKFAGITSTSTSEEGEDTAGARGRKLVEQVRFVWLLECETLCCEQS